MFLPPIPLDDLRLPPQIPLIFDRRLGRNDVQVAVLRAEVKAHVAAGNQGVERNFGLFERLSGGKPPAVRQPDQRPLERLEVALEARAACGEPLPSRV